MNIFTDYPAIKLAVILQDYNKTVREKKAVISQNLRKYYELAYATMSHIQGTYEKGIFTKNTYNTNMEELDNILVFYNFIKSKFKIIWMSKYKLSQIDIFIEILHNRLINLIELIGSSNIPDIINLITNKNIL